MEIILSEKPLHLATLSQKLEPHATTGAVCSFTGYMRNHNEGQAVASMFLDYYPSMTEAVLQDVATEAKRRWPVQTGLIAHRVGTVKPTDLLVYVEVHCHHRQEAFDACNFIMDTLKTRAPFWKKEQLNGTERWVEQRDSDLAALDKWQE